jgi:hypothetical protein
MVNPWIEFMKATKGRGMTMDQKRVAYRRQQANVSVSVSVSKPNKAMLSQRRRLQYRSTGGGFLYDEFKRQSYAAAKLKAEEKQWNAELKKSKAKSHSEQLKAKKIKLAQAIAEGRTEKRGFFHNRVIIAPSAKEIADEARAGEAQKIVDSVHNADAWHEAVCRSAHKTAQALVPEMETCLNSWSQSMPHLRETECDRTISRRDNLTTARRFACENIKDGKNRQKMDWYNDITDSVLHESTGPELMSLRKKNIAVIQNTKDEIRQSFSDVGFAVPGQLVKACGKFEPSGWVKKCIIEPVEAMTYSGTGRRK